MSSGAEGEAVPAALVVLRRSDLERAVVAGLGVFLQHAELEPVLDSGRFQGFRVLTLTPPEFWLGVDLQPGDIVTHVNGKSVEDPNVMYDTFVGLRTATELRVDSVREGKARTWSLPISGPPLKGPEAAASAPAAAK